MFKNLKRILLAVYRIEERQKEILDRLQAIEVNGQHGDTESSVNSASALLQEGIDNIMGYQWPPKKGGNE